MVNTQAVQDVLAERKRQIEVEGWTPEHDDKHDDGELADAAGCYAIHGVSPAYQHQCPRDWPWDERWWKPGTHRRNLVKATALLLAEIERLDRQQPPERLEVDRLRARVAELEAALQKAADLLHAGEITVAAITAFTVLADKELGKARGLPTTCGSPGPP